MILRYCTIYAQCSLRITDSELKARTELWQERILSCLWLSSRNGIVSFPLAVLFFSPIFILQRRQQFT